MKDKIIYLISDYRYADAKRIAFEQGIPENRWIFVPDGLGSTDIRRRTLCGRNGIPQDHLIGFFTSQEVEQLTSK